MGSEGFAHEAVFDVAVEEDVAFREITEFLVEGQGVALGFENKLGVGVGAGGLLDAAHQQRADSLSPMFAQHGDTPDLADAVTLIDQTGRADNAGHMGNFGKTGEEVGSGDVVGVQLLFRGNGLLLDKDGHTNGKDRLALCGGRDRSGLVMGGGVC